MLLAGDVSAQCPPYPQFTTLTGPGIKNPYSKTHGSGEHAVTTYQVRIDSSDFDGRYSHLSYLPGNGAVDDIAVTADTHIFWGVNLVLRIDRGATGDVDLAYRLRVAYGDAGEFAKNRLPQLIAHAQNEREPLEYLHEVLVQQYNATVLDSTKEQKRFEEQVRQATARICR